VCVPTARFALLNEAELPFSATTPNCVWPSRYVIEPVGTPVPDCGATPAVNVTFWPAVNCVAEARTEVVVAILAGAEIVTDTAADVEAAKFASPEYAAVIACEPIARLDVSNAADPDEFRDLVPICVPPSLNVTVPVGTPDPDFGATVAVHVIACPEIA
jgi:hypothetical protein